MVKWNERLKALRLQKGISQIVLADLLGVGKSSISGYESGTREPGVKALLTLIDYFDVTADYFFGLSDDPQPNSNKIAGKQASKIDSSYDGLNQNDQKEVRDFIQFLENQAK